MNVSVGDGWNLISVPVQPVSNSKDSLFRFSTSQAYAYNNGYAATGSLIPGKGYWLKFNGAQTLTINGETIEAETVDVFPKWNLVGSISSEILTSNITSIPPGLVASQFFTFNNGYTTSGGVIKPGKGYWVRASDSGKFIFSSTTVTSAANKIKIVPISELPPPPPDGQYSNPKIQLPQHFALEQNYPNPFNPATVIRYQLPDVSRNGIPTYNVTLKIFNVLGLEIATLVDEVQEAGYKSATFNASNLSSGMYFYRITAIQKDGGQASGWSDMKKLMLIK